MNGLPKAENCQGLKNVVIESVTELGLNTRERSRISLLLLRFHESLTGAIRYNTTAIIVFALLLFSVHSSNIFAASKAVGFVGKLHTASGSFIAVNSSQYRNRIRFFSFILFYGQTKSCQAAVVIYKSSTILGKMLYLPLANKLCPCWRDGPRYINSAGEATEKYSNSRMSVYHALQR
jgi:hypothetical protein